MLVSGRNASCLRKQCWSCSFHLFRSLSFLSVLEYQVSIGSLSLGDRAAEPVFHRYVDPVFQTSDAAQRIRMRQGRSWSLILQLDLYMTYDYDLYTMYIADDCSGLRWIGQGIYTFPSPSAQDRALVQLPNVQQSRRRLWASFIFIRSMQHVTTCHMV